MSLSYLNDGEMIPVFPLPNTIVFPTVSLPLFIFEPRYIEMIDDILDKKGIFALATVSEKWEGIHEKDFEFFPMGSICRILDYRSVEGNRYNLVVQATNRARFFDCQYRENKLYRSVKVNLEGFDIEEDLDEEKEKNLRSIAKEIFRKKAIEMDIEKYRFSEMSNLHVINMLCLGCPISMKKKHAIFCKESINDIYEELISYYPAND